MDNILPVLDSAVLQEKANEFAMKGALKSLEEYYSGYNSPYRKAIEEQLKAIPIGGSIQLPDIVALINDALTKEIDALAHATIAKTFIPMVSSFLVREQKEIRFSDVLKQFVEATEAKDYEDCEISMKLSSYGWYDVELSTEDKNYRLTLHEEYSTKKDEAKKYQFLSLPYEYGGKVEQMKLKIDGATLELPFTTSVLKDSFTAYIGRLIIAGSKITLDTRDFSEDMFPERCHC